jgi:hypothetical protein
MRLRLGPSGEKPTSLIDANATNHHIDQYPAVSGPVKLRSRDIALFKHVAGDSGAYQHLGKGCTFEPGIGLEIYSQGDTARGLICFACNQWYLKSDSVRVGGDFDSLRPAFLKLAKSLFPNDEEIRKL